MNPLPLGEFRLAIRRLRKDAGSTIASVAAMARHVGIGLIAGLALAVAGARLIRSLLYQVEPLDPLTLVTTAAVIFGLALLVSLPPALEATRVDLNRTLREE